MLHVPVISEVAAIISSGTRVNRRYSLIFLWHGMMSHYTKHTMTKVYIQRSDLQKAHLMGKVLSFKNEFSEKTDQTQLLYTVQNEKLQSNKQKTRIWMNENVTEQKELTNEFTTFHRVWWVSWNITSVG